jgi:hypothetical protein
MLSDLLFLLCSRLLGAWLGFVVLLLVSSRDLGVFCHLCLFILFRHGAVVVGFCC